MSAGSGARKRSPEAKARRAPKRREVTRNGRRIVCDSCKALHPAPECPPDVEPVTLSVRLPYWLHRELKGRVVEGERSAWTVRLIRKALDL